MRFVRLSALAIGIAWFASCSESQKPAAKAAPEPSAYARIQAIPPADTKKYGEAHSYRKWRNPYLIIRTDGVGLLDAANNEERLIKLEDLPEVLAQLPPSAWPYGRVVAVTENGVRASGDDAVMRKNRGIVLGTLESMHVLVSTGPPPG